MNIPFQLPPTPKRPPINIPSLATYAQSVDVWTKQAQQTLKQLVDVTTANSATVAQIASSTQTGLLSSTDWTTFNNKQPPGNYVTEAPLTGGPYARQSASWVAISVASGNLTESTSDVLTITGGTGAVLGSGTTIDVKKASTSQDGYLSSTDWATFNNKQSTLLFGNLNVNLVSGMSITGGTNAVIGSGATISMTQASAGNSGFLLNTDWMAFNGKLSDAPSDGNIYGRQNGAWTITGSSGSTNILQVQVFS